jgi:hypothetical protein
MKIFLAFLLFIPSFLFSQKLDDKLQARIEYSVNGKNANYIFSNANSWVENEFRDRKMIMSECDSNSKRILGLVYDKDFDFIIEINCQDGRFVAKFSNFFYKRKPLEQDENKIEKINQYLFELSGRMQKYIRYNEVH